MLCTKTCQAKFAYPTCAERMDANSVFLCRSLFDEKYCLSSYRGPSYRFENFTLWPASTPPCIWQLRGSSCRNDPIIERLRMKFTANSKRQKWYFCCLSSSVCTVESKYLYLLWIIRDTSLFLCDLFNDYKKGIENHWSSLPFAVCRKRYA